MRGVLEYEHMPASSVDGFIFVGAKCESLSKHPVLRLISQSTTWSIQNSARLQDTLGICEFTWHGNAAAPSC